MRQQASCKKLDAYSISTVYFLWSENIIHISSAIPPLVPVRVRVRGSEG
jgi:hypothetical protein